MHLCRFGFKADYKAWTSHGKRLVNSHVKGGCDRDLVKLTVCMKG
jgi:hypothetical protein